MKMTLRTKMSLAFAVVLVLMGLMAGIIVGQISAVNQKGRQNYTDGLIGVKLTGDAIAEALRVRERLLLLSSATTTAEQLRQRERMEVHTARMFALIEAYQPLIETDGAQAAIADFNQTWADYTVASDEVVRLALAGESDKAAIALRGDAEHQLEQAINLLLLVQDIEDNLARVRFEESQALFQRATILAVGMTGVAILAGLGLAFWLARTIADPMAAMAQTAQQLAQGDLSRTVPVTVRSRDEIGVLGRAFNSMTDQLRDLIGSLEQRVANRTRRLEIVASLGERLSAILDLNQLLAEVVNQVQDNFGYYHVHIYLFDDQGQKLVVAEGTGSAGAEMKATGHNIPLDAPASLVARAARTGQIVRVDNVQEAEDWLPNPLLPATRAEMAVPIVLGAEGQVVGVLDVQADEIGGLGEGDAYLLRSLANQVAVAIHNARLFAEVETALAEAKAAQEHYLQQSWTAAKQADQPGEHRYHRPGAPVLGEALMARLERQAWGQSQPAVVAVDDENAERGPALVAPIRLQNQTIGAIQLHQTDPARPRQWGERERALVEIVADQVAQVAENIRLFNDTRKRAGRERAIREITDLLRAAPNLERLVAVATEELGRRLSATHAKLELGLEEESAPGQPGQNGQADGRGGR